MLKIVLACLTTVYVVAFIGHSILTILYPMQMEYGEGVTYGMCDMAARGEPLYRNLETYPWAKVTYTPVYLVVTGLLMRYTVWSHAAGRALSTVSYLAVVGLFYGTLNSQYNRRTATAGCLLFSLSALTFYWPSLVRVDFLALVFEMLALAAVQRRWDVAAGAFGALAFFTKPSVLAVMFGVTLYLLVTDRSRLRVFLPALAGTLAAGAALMAAWSGPWFFQQVFANNATGLDVATTRYLCTHYFPAVALVWLLAASARTYDRFWLCYLAGSLCTALLVVRSMGFYNHFLELQLATSALAAIALEQRLLSAGLKGEAVAWAVVLLQVGGAGLCLPLDPYIPSPLDYLRLETASWMAGRPVVWYQAGVTLHRDVTAWLAQHPGDVLAENVGNMLECGRRPVIVDPEPLFVLGEQGKWNEGPFLLALQNHRFAVIMMQGPRFPAHIREEIGRYYEPVVRIDDIEVMLLPRHP